MESEPSGGIDQPQSGGIPPIWPLFGCTHAPCAPLRDEVKPLISDHTAWAKKPMTARLYHFAESTIEPDLPPTTDWAP